ncbi:hypothetical protein BN874_1720004 [Candidatus Contendobacter odensis Run_B_J11]|uniref:Uncharacterized protein n=1 Tax=Candidatus Contendobacter odensis Run_B_J11 TaxID=1400861 RepID=A0A7U7G9S3_9GAMM|nr:hypothetical protein BN874_1720004 [Candidatus Contendobacter odensis Run_B_J11]
MHLYRLLYPRRWIHCNCYLIRMFRDKPRPSGRGGITEGAAVPRVGTGSAPRFLGNIFNVSYDLPPGGRDVKSVERR